MSEKSGGIIEEEPIIIKEEPFITNSKESVKPKNTPIFEKNKQEIQSLFEKGEIKPPEPDIFDWRYCIQGSQKRLYLFFIALYWRQKEYKFESRTEASYEINRSAKRAKEQIERYSIKKFKKMLEWIDEQDYTWTMETIDKKIGDYNKDNEEIVI